MDVELGASEFAASLLDDLGGMQRAVGPPRQIDLADLNRAVADWRHVVRQLGERGLGIEIVGAQLGGGGEAADGAGTVGAALQGAGQGIGGRLALGGGRFGGGGGRGGRRFPGGSCCCAVGGCVVGRELEAVVDWGLGVRREGWVTW